ncbi:MAG TPA: TldD/PmbA family protein [Thermoanaerobaculia bacterium]|jgi:TldD protein
MPLDPSAVARFLEPLARESGEIADVFVERRQEIRLEWRDGAVGQTRRTATEGLAVRWRRGGSERICAVSRADEAGLREASRQLQAALGRGIVPIRSAAPPAGDEWRPLSGERWRKRLEATLSRHAPRHELRWTLADVDREIYPARAPAAVSARRLTSLEGTFIAPSRRGDETRRFSFHGPESETLADELREALVRAAEPRDAAVPCPEGDADVLLAAGCAAVLFHEILVHPLEGGAVSPLSGLSEARVAVPELEVRDDAARLDLFGGYECDDEGIRPRPVKLLDAGRIAGRLTSRDAAAPAGRDASNGHGRRAEPGDSPLPRGANVVVAPGSASAEEMVRRLEQGLWIDALDGGSVELASGSFRLRFPRARRVRRGRLSDELGPGMLAGEILPVLKRIETGLGREVRAYRPLGWCARGGQILPVQGEAPDVLVRGLAVRGLA